MRATSKILALALVAALQPAVAGTVELYFEDVTSTEALTTRYAGAPWGVTASGAAYTAVSETCAPTYPLRVSFSRSCGALWLLDTGASGSAFSSLTLSVAGGFTGLSFLYAGSSESTDLEVHVYDAQGIELGIGLGDLQGSVSPGYQYTNWSQPKSPLFTGLASTVTFTARNSTILLDDIKFTTADAPGTPLPEPASLALAIGALGALGWSRRRAAR